MCMILTINFFQNILPANDDERAVIDQLTSSLFNSLNLEDPIEKLCDELLDPPPINFNNLPDPSLIDEPSECPTPPGDQQPIPCG